MKNTTKNINTNTHAHTHGNDNSNGQIDVKTIRVSITDKIF